MKFNSQTDQPIDYNIGMRDFIGKTVFGGALGEETSREPKAEPYITGKKAYL